MTLAPGTKLGPYKIEALLGAGGMGEVYRATDPRIPRTVAIKVLPATVADDPGRRARFEREARTIGSLNHPHICTLFDVGRLRPDGAVVGQGEDIDFLVMELVEGETLASRLARGPVPLEDALRHAGEITSALDRAHRHGIVHRDLKPANVMLTKTGVKLLDFGLAKFTQSPMSGDAALSTRAADGTADGAILGTLPYMSPEQLEGREADARSDIFAFGAVLYEMLSGRQAFQGKSQASLISAILRDQPPPIATTMAPAPLERVVRTCLEKDPDNRWQSAADLGRELKWAAESLRSGEPSRQIGPADKVGNHVMVPRSVVVAIGLGLIALAGLGAWNAWAPKRGAGDNKTAGVVRASIDLRPAEMLGRKYMGLTGGLLISARPSRTELAITPDGRVMVFSGTRGDTTQLYVRPLDRDEVTPIRGTEGARAPFISPHGESIGFWADNQLKRVAVGGGDVTKICDADNAYGQHGIMGATWSEDGTIVFQRNLAPELFTVSSGGGSPSPLKGFDSGTRRIRTPHFLPGGDVLLFTSVTGNSTDFDWPDARVEAFWLKTGQRKVLLQGGSDARYVPTGHLLYMDSGRLMAVSFDAAEIRITGTPVPVVESVMHAVKTPGSSLETGAGQFAVSNTGVLLFVDGGIHPLLQATFFWMDRHGIGQPLTLPKAAYYHPRLSSDGRRLLYATDNLGRRQRDLFVLELPTGIPSQLTFTDENRYGVWSPDDRRIVFARSSAGKPHALLVLDARGLGGPTEVTTGPEYQLPTSWTGTSDVVAIMQGPEASSEIWTLSMRGDGKPTPFVKPSTGAAAHAVFSPDGRWLAYVSNETGDNQVYVTAYPGPGPHHRVSAGGGTEPLWSRDGSELFFRNGRQVLAVKTGTNPLASDRAVPLFEADFTSTNLVRNWDIGPDGRFLMSRLTAGPDDEPVRHVNIVFNWFQELKEKVKPGK